MAISVPWTPETVGQLKKLGFNTVQLNVAWGRRPGDEPLNLEDVVQLDPKLDRRYPQVVPLRSKLGEEARDKRRTELSRKSWARLISRVYLEDPSLCRSCQKPMRIISALTSPHQDEAIEKILRHRGECTVTTN